MRHDEILQQIVDCADERVLKLSAVSSASLARPSAKVQLETFGGDTESPSERVMLAQAGIHSLRSRFDRRRHQQAAGEAS